MFVDISNGQEIGRYFDTPHIGEKAVRRCGNYFEYCDGACNSCPKGQCTASDHTVLTFQSASNKTEQISRSTAWYQRQYLINKFKEFDPSYEVNEFEYPCSTLR